MGRVGGHENHVALGDVPADTALDSRGVIEDRTTVPPVTTVAEPSMMWCTSVLPACASGVAPAEWRTMLISILIRIGYGCGLGAPGALL